MLPRCACSAAYNLAGNTIAGTADVMTVEKSHTTFDVSSALTQTFTSVHKAKRQQPVQLVCFILHINITLCCEINIKSSNRYNKMASTSKDSIGLRSKTEIYLVGHPCHAIMGSKLPSKRQILSMYFFNTRNRKMQANASALLVADAAMIFWRQAAIPTRDRGDVRKKITALHEEWYALQKNAIRGGPAQANKEKTFVDQLDDLFDIAHADALTTTKNKEDVEFLKMQRQKGRQGCMIGVDDVLFGIQKRRAEREEEEEARRKRANVQPASGEF